MEQQTNKQEPAKISTKLLIHNMRELAKNKHKKKLWVWNQTNVLKEKRSLLKHKELMMAKDVTEALERNKAGDMVAQFKNADSRKAETTRRLNEDTGYIALKDDLLKLEDDIAMEEFTISFLRDSLRISLAEVRLLTDEGELHE